MLTPVLEFGPPGLKFLRPVELRMSKPSGARGRTLKVKSSSESFWKEMYLDDDGDDVYAQSPGGMMKDSRDQDGEITSVFINQF